MLTAYPDRLVTCLLVASIVRVADPFCLGHTWHGVRRVQASPEWLPPAPVRCETPGTPLVYEARAGPEPSSASHC